MKLFTGKRRNGKSTKLVKEFCTFDPDRPETHTHRVLYTRNNIGSRMFVESLANYPPYDLGKGAYISPFGYLFIRNINDIFDTNSTFSGLRPLVYIDEWVPNYPIEALAIESADAIKNFSDEEIAEEYLKRTEMWKALK
jgi:hypothetical protein